MNENNEYCIYRVSSGWRWFFYIAFPSMAAFFGCGLYLPFASGSHIQPGVAIYWELFCGVFILLFVGSIFSAVKSRIEVNANEIRSVGLFSTKRMALKEIEGFKILPTQYVRTLVLVPRSCHGRKMRLQLIYERRADLIDWANLTLKNLDAIQYQTELDEIYHEEKLGDSPEEKANNLKRAGKWCRGLNLISLPIIYWGFAWPQPYRLVIWVLIALPIVGLLFLNYFKGIVRLDARRGSAYPTVALPFISGPLVLALRAFVDWHILDWHGVWEPCAAISAALLSLTFSFAKDFRKKFGSAVMYTIFCMAYGYGATITLNGILANSAFKSYQARIVNKHLNTGKQTDYYLTLSPWGPRKDADDVQVGRAIYNKYPAGNTATIYVRDGRFGIPYYFVR